MNTFDAGVYVHNLETLIKLAGLEMALNEEMKRNKHFEVNWSIVKDWNESSRYEANISAQKSKDLYSACTSRSNGILSWIKTKW